MLAGAGAADGMLKVNPAAAGVSVLDLTVDDVLKENIFVAETLEDDVTVVFVVPNPPNTLDAAGTDVCSTGFVEKLKVDAPPKLVLPVLAADPKENPPAAGLLSVVLEKLSPVGPTELAGVVVPKEKPEPLEPNALFEETPRPLEEPLFAADMETGVPNVNSPVELELLAGFVSDVEKLNAPAPSVDNPANAKCIFRVHFSNTQLFHGGSKRILGECVKKGKYLKEKYSAHVVNQ